MKRIGILHKILFFTASVFFTFSCMSDLPDEYLEPQVSKGEAISIKVSMPQNQEGGKDSRVAFDDSQLALSWEDGDQLALVGYSNNAFVGKSTLTLSEKAANKAVFTGSTVKGATHYDAYYPASAVDAKGLPSIKYDGQTQNGNDNTVHLKNVILLKQEVDKLTTDDLLLTDKDIPMKMQNAIVKFDLNNIFINNPVAIEWEIEAEGGAKTTRTLSIAQNPGNDIQAQFIGYFCIPELDLQANNITVSVLGKKEGDSPYRPLNYHIDVNKKLHYASNQRYTARIEKGWIYKIYYKSNLNINDAFEKDPDIKNNIAKKEYDEGTEWGFIDLKQDDNVALKNLRIPEVKKTIEYLDIYGISQISPKAFKGCESFHTITLHEGVTTIGDNAFSGCKKLSSVSLNKGLQTIENDAFHGCEELVTIKIPGSVTAIGSSAFAQCVKLKNITLPKIKTLEKNTFEGCNALEYIVLQEGLQTIGSNAFLNCTVLANINIPSSVKTIESSAFVNSGLTSITIPYQVTELGSKAFDGCKKLTGVTVTALTPPNIIGSGTNGNLLGFPDFPKNKNIKISVPKNSVNAYKEAPGWSSYKDIIFPVE